MSQVLQMDGQGPFDDLDPVKNSAFGRLFSKFLNLFISDTEFTDINAENVDADVATIATLNTTTAKVDQLQLDMAGANAAAGLATLVAGTVTVATTKVVAGSVILLTPRGNANAGLLDVQTITAATSFVIRSASGTDVRVVGWTIINPIT